MPMNPRDPNGWPSWVGAIAVVLGLWLAAAYGVEAARHWVLPSASSGQWSSMWECPEDELIEENVSPRTCEQMAERVGAFIGARADWFRAFGIAAFSAGVVLAIASMFVAMGLLDGRRWAPRAFVLTLGALAGLDLALFAASANSHPIVRDEYLWNSLLWFVLHVGLIAAVVAGVQEDGRAGARGHFRA